MEEISVLIPCYNSGKTIRDCINSVLSQTYPKHNIKIIVANDGSTDNTLEILQNCQMTVGSDNFFIINQENKGISETRNVLIKHVKTK
jgi:glycosyltransferase involved in cell wall biosynthesis